MKCEYCEIVEREGKAPILYIDEELVVAIKDKVMAPGQITIFPRKHYTILEMVPELLIAKCSVVANKVSMALFESLGCQGTNILISNGLASGQSVPHFGIEVIPRIEEDKVGLTWEGKQLNDDEFEMTMRALVEDVKKAQAEKAKKVEKETAADAAAANSESAVLGKDVKVVDDSSRKSGEGKASGEAVTKAKTKSQAVPPLVRNIRRIP